MKKYLIPLLIFTLGFAGGKYYVLWVQKKSKHPAPLFHYTQNVMYGAKTDYFTLYKGRKFKIAMLGDSHTANIEWDILLNREDIINLGIGGDVTAGMANRLDKVLMFEPEICFVQGGINDIGRKQKYHDYLVNITGIIDTLQAHKVKVVCLSTFHVTDSAKEATYINRRVAKFNKGLDSIAAIKKVPVINLNKQLSKGGKLLAQYAQKDGIHLTPAAYLIWCAEITKTL